MDETKLQLAKQSLQVYLEITIKDELIKIVQGKIVEPEKLVELLNERIFTEIKKEAKQEMNKVLKQVSALMKDMK